MPRGGKRPGAGAPKGCKHQKPREKAEVREVIRQRLTAHADVFVDALVSRAKGVRYFVTRNKKTGKYEIVTNPEQVVSALNGEDENTGEFYTDKPDVSAIREALDRMIDRPKEQELTVAVKPAPAEMSDAELIATVEAMLAQVKGDGGDRVH